MSGPPAGNSKPSIKEPSARIKELIEMSHNITVDRNISVSKYFHSGRELIRSASAFEQKGDLEKAFVLYLRYVTLFLEKIIHHPEYKKAEQAEKIHVRNECNVVLTLTEELKKRILDKYQKEYDNLVERSPPNVNDEVQKRTIGSDGSAPRCDIDDIDKRFDFSHRPEDDQQQEGFDPFNIEQLKRSFSGASD